MAVGLDVDICLLVHDWDSHWVFRLAHYNLWSPLGLVL